MKVGTPPELAEHPSRPSHLSRSILTRPSIRPIARANSPAVAGRAGRRSLRSDLRGLDRRVEMGNDADDTGGCRERAPAIGWMLRNGADREIDLVEKPRRGGRAPLGIPAVGGGGLLDGLGM